MSLSLRDVVHCYRSGGVPVLRGVSLTVQVGESVAIVGPSGSGKTTLLTILGLLTKPTAGVVLIDGKTLPPSGAELSRLRAERFGWIFQTANALPRRSVLDNAAFGLLVQGWRRDAARQRAREALGAVGVGHLAAQEARNLSGGELQRVCTARALAARPSFILADEPTGQLDHATSVQVIAALLHNRPYKTAVVIATHDTEVARECDRILRVVDGELQEGLG